MRPRSWLAVSGGTLTGSALAITGSPQSRTRPTATTAHLRMPRTFTKILARGLLAGQGGHLIHFAQASNNGTITPGLMAQAASPLKAAHASRQETFPRSRIGNCQ